jgi:hypothetical protein
MYDADGLPAAGDRTRSGAGIVPPGYALTAANRFPLSNLRKNSDSPAAALTNLRT